MSASVSEQILARVAAVLLAADLVDDRVFRGRRDGFAEDELPGINVQRGPSDTVTHARGVDRTRFEFAVAYLAAGANVETAADALQVAGHVALVNDATLQTLGAGLICTSTDPTPDEADIDVYRLTARYQIQFLTRPGDPTRNLT